MTSEIEDLGSYPKARLKSLRSVLCSTCLSINRDLHPVAALRHLVPLLNDVGLDLNGSICWECRAIMDNFDKFRNRARKANYTLNSLVGKNNIPMAHIYNHVRSLSTLGQSKKNMFDAQFNFHIKEENLRFGDNEQSDFIDSLHTFVDVELEHWQEKAEKEEKEEAEDEEEVYLCPSIQQETVPVENSNMQLLIDKLVPLLVPSAESNLTVRSAESNLTVPLTESNLTVPSAESNLTVSSAESNLTVPSAESNLTVPGSSLARLLAKPSQLPKTLVTNSNSESGSKSDNHEENVDKVRAFSHRDLIIKILTEDEMLKYREEQREQTWFKNAKLRCISCIVYFPSKDALIKHNLLHCPIQQGKFACSICDLKFSSQKAVIIHKHTHYRKYNCRYCSYSSYSQQQMMTHWQRRHGLSANRQCIDCGVEFPRYRQLLYHMKAAHSGKISCLECGKTFVTSVNLNRHMLLHTGTMPEVECDICHKKYRGSWGLRAHMRTHDQTQLENENAYCTECDIKFKNMCLYRVHLKTNSRHVDPDTFKFQCSYCGKKFYCKSILRNHIEAMHLKLNNYECEHCNQTFHNVVQLRKHRYVNHSGKPKTRNNICHLCGKAFTVKKSLNEHMNTHLGKRPFKCMECGATFAYSAALYTHTRLLHLKNKKGKKNSAATELTATSAND